MAVPLGVGETSGRAIASSSASAAPDVDRVLAESEVFVKYGLLERAVDHLGRVFELDPENRTARERLSYVLQKLGRSAEAARQLELLAQQVARQQPAEARALAERAARLDPGVARAPAMNGARSGPHAARDSRPVVVLDVDEDPSSQVVTPPPEVEVGVTPTPLPVESDRSTDQVAFEENVLTGDVVEVAEVAPGGVSLDWDERAGQVTPPPARAPRATGPLGLVGAAPVIDRWGAPPVTPPPAAGAPDEEDLEADLEQVAFFLRSGHRRGGPGAAGGAAASLPRRPAGAGEAARGGGVRGARGGRQPGRRAPGGQHGARRGRAGAAAGGGRGRRPAGRVDAPAISASPTRRWGSTTRPSPS